MLGEEVEALTEDENLAKKSIAQKLRDFLDASPAESNVPMTSDQIGAVEAKKKRKATAKKRSAKSGAKEEQEEIQKGQEEVETLITPDLNCTQAA